MIEYREIDLGFKSNKIKTQIFPQPPTHQNLWFGGDIDCLKIENYDEFRREKLRLDGNKRRVLRKY